MNTQQPEPMGHSKGSPEREVHSNTGLLNKDFKNLKYGASGQDGGVGRHTVPPRTTKRTTI